MEIIRNGSYGAQVHTRNDGQGFDVYFLFNMSDPTYSQSTGDVDQRKTYKSRKTVDRKITEWIESNA